MESSENKEGEKIEKYKKALLLTVEGLRELSGQMTTENSLEEREARVEVLAHQIELDGIRLGALGGGHEKLKVGIDESGELYFRIFDNAMGAEYITQLEGILERKFTENGLIFKKSS